MRPSLGDGVPSFRPCLACRRRAPRSTVPRPLPASALLGRPSPAPARPPRAITASSPASAPPSSSSSPAAARPSPTPSPSSTAARPCLVAGGSAPHPRRPASLILDALPPPASPMCSDAASLLRFGFAALCPLQRRPTSPASHPFVPRTQRRTKEEDNQAYDRWGPRTVLLTV
ncbi:hypothetical protein BS78_02G060600 [Paspalum vaginatum]|nr:hypothetical protein BS78_02G060600 [Paspalum vaginatum]